MLVVKVQLLYNVIHQVDYLIGQKDKYNPVQIVQDHNGTDINRPVCIQVGILITFFKLQRWYEVGSRGSKQDTVFFLSVYTRLT